MKTKDTLAVEAILLRACFGSNPSLARRYGCLEVTLGFAGVSYKDGTGRTYNGKIMSMREYAMMCEKRSKEE